MASNANAKEPLLTIKGLKTYFPVKGGFLGKTKSYVQAVNDINLTIYKGETLGLVGESGCGKTTLLKNIYVESVLKQDYHSEQIDLLMRQLFILFSRQLHTYPNTSGIPADLYEQFCKARIEILTNIDREWNTDSMAALTNLGISQFYNYYKLFFNRSPKAELLDARLERAKYLLRVEAMPVGQAAAQAGFANLSHFTRYFRKQCGISPSEYARSNNKAAEIPLP